MSTSSPLNAENTPPPINDAGSARPERRVAINSGLLLVAFSFQAVVSLIMVGIVARYLGQAGLGRYAYVVSFIELFIALVDMGMNRILVREVSRGQIVGHTDSAGDREHNMDLSRRRAEAVRNYLIGRGIDATRLESKGFGPDAPLESNKTRAGKAKNRRIEFKLID